MRERRRSVGSGASLSRSSSVESRPEAGPDFHVSGGEALDDRALSPVTALAMASTYDQRLGAHREVWVGWSKRSRKGSIKAISSPANPDSQEPTNSQRSQAKVVRRHLALATFHPVSFIDLLGGQVLAKKQSPAPTHHPTVSTVEGPAILLCHLGAVGPCSHPLTQCE
jgi:hypothetical protein